MGGGILEILFGEGYGRIAVPMFLLISGYLFFPSRDIAFSKNFYISKIKKRAKSLLVPYLLWNLIAYLLYAINNGFNIVDFFKSFWVIDLPGRTGSSPMDGPLWYVRNLMILMIASLMIYYLCRHKVVIILLLVLWFIGIKPFDKGIFIALTFFATGGWLRFKGYSSSKLKGYWFYVIFIVILFALPFLGHQLAFGYAQRLMILTGMLSLISIAKLMPNSDNSLYMTLASATFFIYCCHDILLTYLKPMAIQVSTSWWSYLLLTVTDLVCCLLLYYGLTKVFPKYSRLLTGGR
ncbi:MAG: acyltransferase [Prevotella sp.]|jgi:fucose 4-O-acetylase-like acetyltransferase|nr:acyltransferase [Prevotella sp.]MCI2088611.1 acyltransferase [Prevotella sp.]MCI2125844.1 acyltransferase [Prevotella sp.]